MKNVLLIEPDYILAGIYKNALQQNGFQVKHVGGAQTAITAADNKTPDIVILELQLIEHSGIEFLYEFRSYNDWQNIPVIIQTQVPPGEFKDSWQILKEELNIDIYLYKPSSNINHLLKNIRSLSLVKS